jgi:hypothetical protein
MTGKLLSILFGEGLSFQPSRSFFLFQTLFISSPTHPTTVTHIPSLSLNMDVKEILTGPAGGEETPFSLSFEFFPPKTLEAAQRLITRMKTLKENFSPTFVDITWSMKTHIYTPFTVSFCFFCFFCLMMRAKHHQ